MTHIDSALLGLGTAGGTLKIFGVDPHTFRKRQFIELCERRTQGRPYMERGKLRVFDTSKDKDLQRQTERTNRHIVTLTDFIHLLQEVTS